MKRSEKFYKDKKLRRTMVEYYKQRRGRYSDKKYSLFRDGWKVQYVLSKEIKKNPIGEYLQQILYLIVDQRWTNTLEDVGPIWKNITKDEYDKLTSGQKMCFVKSSHVEALLNTGNGMYIPMEITDYQIDPMLKEHIIPVTFKNYRKNTIYEHTELDEKVKRDYIATKATKIMGEKRDWMYYTEPGIKTKEFIRKREMRDEVREFL